MTESISGKIIGILGNTNYRLLTQMAEKISKVFLNDPLVVGSDIVAGRKELVEAVLINHKSYGLPPNSEELNDEYRFSALTVPLVLYSEKGQSTVDQIKKAIRDHVSMDKMVELILILIDDFIDDGSKNMGCFFVFFYLLSSNVCPYVWGTGKVEMSKEELASLQDEPAFSEKIGFLKAGLSGALKFNNSEDKASWVLDQITETKSEEESFVLMLHLVNMLENSRDDKPSSMRLLDGLMSGLESMMIIGEAIFGESGCEKCKESGSKCPECVDKDGTDGG